MTSIQGVKSPLPLASSAQPKPASTTPPTPFVSDSTLNDFVPANCLPGAGPADGGITTSGGSASVQINQKKIAVTNLKEADGTPDNKSQVVVPLNTAIKSTDLSKMSLKATITTPMRKTVTIPILSATVDPKNPKNLIIKTGQQVPKGATLTLGAGSLTTTAGKKNYAVSTTTPTGIDANAFAMTNRAFKPTNVNMFTKDAFPNASTAPVPAAGNYTEAQAKSELTALYNKQVAAGNMTSKERTQRLAQFDAASTKAIVPDPKLRAGLFSLAGTSSSGAIDAVLTNKNQSGKPYSSIKYDPAFTASFAAAAGNADGTRILKVNNTVKGEPIEAIGALFAHEVMHQDNINGQQEEVIAESARAVAWSEMLLLNPALASKNTPLVRANNSLSLALLNSGNGAYPQVGITSAPQIQRGSTPVDSKVFVGGSNFKSLDNYARTNAFLGGVQDIDTAGNQYLTDYLSKVSLTNNVTNNGFSRQTRDQIDVKQKSITNAEALKLAQTLKLTA